MKDRGKKRGGGIWNKTKQPNENKTRGKRRAVEASNRDRRKAPNDETQSSNDTGERSGSGQESGGGRNRAEFDDCPPLLLGPTLPRAVVPLPRNGILPCSQSLCLGMLQLMLGGGLPTCCARPVHAAFAGGHEAVTSVLMAREGESLGVECPLGDAIELFICLFMGTVSQSVSQSWLTLDECIWMCQRGSIISPH